MRKRWKIFLLAGGFLLLLAGAVGLVGWRFGVLGPRHSIIAVLHLRGIDAINLELTDVTLALEAVRVRLVRRGRRSSGPSRRPDRAQGPHPEEGVPMARDGHLLHAGGHSGSHTRSRCGRQCDGNWPDARKAVS